MVREIQDCQKMLRSLEGLITENDIKAIVVELLGGSKNSNVAKTFGLIEGVFSALLERARLPYYTYPATDVKKALTGKKTASKDKITEAVQELFPELFTRPEFQKVESLKTGKKVWPRKLEHITDSIALMTYAEDQNDFRVIFQMAIEAAEREEVVENDDFFD